MNDIVDKFLIFWPHLLMLAVAIIILLRHIQRYPTYPKALRRPFALGVIGLSLATVAVFLPQKLLSMVFLVGWVIGLFGFIAGWKIFFRRMSAEEIKRQVDPGYDLDYTLCPNCKNSLIRRDASPHRCPVCQTSVARPSASNKPPS